MTSRPARSAVAAAVAACLLVAASGGAAAHATAVFDSRDIAVDADGTVEVGITFHNVERAEFRLEGPDGFRLTGTVRNAGGTAATLTLDAGAAGRGDAGAALRVSGGVLRNPTVENAPGGPLPPGGYGTSLFARGLTVDRGTLTVTASATAGATADASGTVSTAGPDADASPDAPRTAATDADPSDRSGGERATTAGGTTVAAPGFGGVAAALGGLLALLAVVGAAVRRRR